MHGPADDHRLVFVCGLHRSGTTQLAATLATHPDVSGMTDTGAPHDEGQHLQDVVPTARAHGGPGRFAFDPAAHLTETSPLATAGSARRLFAQWSAHWDLDAPVLVEKSPPNLVRMRFLQALFPQAYFVVIVRHPLVTALATRKLATRRVRRLLHRPFSPVATARHWFAAHRVLLDDRPHVRRLHLLRWEDLCADPAGTLDAIAAFVDVRAEFTPPDLDTRVDTRYADEWAAMTGRGTREARALEVVLHSNDDLAAAFGYRGTEPAVRDPLPS